MSIVTYENVDTPIFDIYYPRYLFASGDDGSLLPDLSAPVDSLFQDSAGTIPVTAYGDYVGLAEDQSGNSRDWIQATSAARMRYGRMPRSGVRNLLDNTTDLAGTYYIRNNLEVEASGESSPRGGEWFSIAIGAALAPTSFYPNFHGFPPPKTGPTRISFYARAGSWDFVKFGVILNSSNYASCVVSLVDGTLQTADSSGTVLGVSQVDVQEEAGDVYLISGTLGVAVTGVTSRRVFILPHDSPDALGDPFAERQGDGVSGIFISDPQYEDGEVTTPYQQVANQWDITESGVPDQPILYADLADDAMDIELPAITGGTIVLAGEKGIWIDEFDFAGGTFSYGPTTYTGGPALLIENLVGERLIGGFVIDRALTATERAQNIDYYMSRGAPGVWEAGDNFGATPSAIGSAWTDNTDGSYTYDSDTGISSPLIFDDVGSSGIQYLYLARLSVSSVVGGGVRFMARTTSSPYALVTATARDYYSVINTTATDESFIFTRNSTVDTEFTVADIEFYRLTLNTGGAE